MTGTDVIVLIILIVIIGAAITYMVKAKKQGVKCIGCPAAGNCSKSHGKSSGCGCDHDCE